MHEHDEDPGHYFTDDLEEIARRSMAFGKGRNLPLWTSPFARLARGKTLGRRSVLNVTGAVGAKTVNSTQIDILEIRGEDDDAMQIGLTLCPPKALATLGLALPPIVDDINGQMDSEQLLAIGAGFVWGRCEAIIEWGIGGTSCRVDADFHNGLLVNMQASWMRVRGNFKDDGGGLAAAAYALTAFVGPAHASPSVAQSTVHVGNVTAPLTNSLVFPIPRFARNIQITCDAMDATNDYTLFLNRGTNIPSQVSAIRFLAAAGSSPYFPTLTAKIPIPGNAYYFHIQNNSAGIGAGSRIFRAIFDLAV